MIRTKGLPRPTCCKAAGATQSYREAKLYFWVSPDKDEPGHGWSLWEITGFVSFCPWCGVKLPEMKQGPVTGKVVVITDGGYYCDTCRERLDNCECHAPAEFWVPA